jgi:hypothetical protein
VYVCESNSRMQEPLLWTAYNIKLFHWHWALTLYVNVKDFSMCIPGTMPIDIIDMRYHEILHIKQSCLATRTSVSPLVFNEGGFNRSSNTR